MANVDSARKRNRQAPGRRRRNLYYLSTMRTRIKAVQSAMDEKNATAARAALTEAVRRLDKAAQAGVIKKKNASRKISRLVRAIARLEQGAAASPPA